jgi:hypothetical protein
MVMTGLSAAANNRRGINQTPVAAITLNVMKWRRETSGLEFVFMVILRFLINC